MRMVVFLLFFLMTDLSYAIEPQGTGDSTMEDVSEVGSAASFDKRLPPVIPGESIQHNGNKMKVWSSAGPVPIVTNNSLPSQQGRSSSDGRVGVIVDQRDSSKNSGSN